MSKKITDTLKELESQLQDSEKENKSIDLLATKIDKLADTIVDSNEEMIATFVEGTKRIINKKDGIDVSPSIENLSKSITQGLEAVKTGVSEVERGVKSIKMPSNVDFRATGTMLKLPIKELTRAINNKEELPRSADDPISVRLSDGKEFYKALDTIVQQISGGGATSYAFDTQQSSPTKAATVKVTIEGKERDVIAIVNPDGTSITSSTPTGVGHGVKTVTTAGTDVILASSTTCKKVDIQAQTDNTGLIAIGASGVDATVATGTGIILYPGDVYSLEIDNLSDIYIDSTVNGEGVRYTYYT